MVINPSANEPPPTPQSCHCDQSEIHPRWWRSIRHRALSLRIFHHTNVPFVSHPILVGCLARRPYFRAGKGKIINVHRANERRPRGLAGRIDIRCTEISHSLPPQNRQQNRIGIVLDRFVATQFSFSEIRHEILTRFRNATREEEREEDISSLMIWDLMIRYRRGGVSRLLDS